MSIATATRDAVVTAINQAMTAGTLTPKLTAIPIYEITNGLDTLRGGRIMVMPSTDDITLLNRQGAAQHAITLHVGIQYKATNTAPAAQVAELDPYLTLADSIIDEFLGQSVTGAGACIGAKYPNGLWIPEHMEKHKALTTVVALTFVVNQ